MFGLSIISFHENNQLNSSSITITALYYGESPFQSLIWRCFTSLHPTTRHITEGKEGKYFSRITKKKGRNIVLIIDMFW